jgi:hypothetical protein
MIDYLEPPEENTPKLPHQNILDSNQIGGNLTVTRY